MRARWLVVALIPVLWIGAAAGEHDWAGVGVCSALLLALLTVGVVDKVMWP